MKARNSHCCKAIRRAERTSIAPDPAGKVSLGVCSKSCYNSVDLDQGQPKSFTGTRDERRNTMPVQDQSRANLEVGHVSNVTYFQLLELAKF
jgi:hypothetical protein